MIANDANDLLWLAETDFQQNGKLNDTHTQRMQALHSSIISLANVSFMIEYLIFTDLHKKNSYAMNYATEQWHAQVV